MKIVESLPGMGTRRLRLGLSMADCAAAIGVTRQGWYQWETGRTLPSAAYLPAIAEVLQCEIKDLYVGEEAVSDDAVT